MRRTGYAVGGSVGDSPLDSYGSWSSSSAAGGGAAGAMPEIPGTEGGAPGGMTGGDFSAGADTGGGGEAAYQHGGSVRRRRRRRRRLLRRRPRRLLNGRHPPRLRRRPRRRRRLRTGYAGGGSISPALMSVSLDTRSKNPAHYAEDREPLATRPAGAPGAPDAYGFAQGGEVFTPTADFSPQANFTPTIGAAIDNRLSMMDGAEPEGDEESGGEEEMRRGGPVRRRKRGRRRIGRTGYQEGGEVDEEEFYEPSEEDEFTPDEEEMPEGMPPDEEEMPEGMPPDEEEMPEEMPEGMPPEEDEGEGGGQAQPEEEPPPEEDGGGGGSKGGGGGGGGEPPSSRQPQDQQDEEDIPAGAQPTGYSPDAAPAQSPLKEVLDYTRKQFGVGQEKPAAPAEPPPSDREAAANEVASRIPVPTGEPSGRTGIGAPDDTSTELPPPTPQPETAAPAVPGQTGMPTPPRAAPPPQQSIVTGSNQAPRGESQGVQAYTSGAGALSPDQMTQLLDRTNQTNPNLGQDGAIHKAFNDLVSKGDIDTASKFVQALRPSYDNMRALMIAAVAKGDFASAMQVAEKMNNLVPNGQQIQFAQGNGGIISAIIKPEGGQPTALQMTPEQFGRYANSPLSLFDHVSEQGLAKNLSMVGAQPRPEYNAQGDVPRGAPPGSRNVQIPDGRTLTIAPDPGSMERGQPTYTRGLVVSETPTGQRPYDITSPANARVSQGQPAAPYGTAAERANPRIGYSGTASDRFYAPYGQLGGGPAPPMPDGSPGGPIPAYPPPPRSGLAGTQYAENRTGGTMTDAGPQGGQQVAQAPTAAQARPPAAGPVPAPDVTRKPLATGYQPTDYERQRDAANQGYRPSAPQQPQQRQAGQQVPLGPGWAPHPGSPGWISRLEPSGARTIIKDPNGAGGGQPSRQPAGQQAPGQQRAPGQESEAMRTYRLDKKAYDAFPYDNQDTRRGEYRRALEIQDQKQRAAQEQNKYRETPTDKRSLQEQKDKQANYRAELRDRAMRDTNWITNQTRNMDASVRAYGENLKARQSDFTRRNATDPDAKMPLTEKDKAFLDFLSDRFMNNQGGRDYNQRQTPGPGGEQPDRVTPQEARPPPRQDQQPTAPQQPPAPQLPAGTDLKTYRGDKPPGGSQFPADSPWVWGRDASGVWSYRLKKQQ